VEGYRRYFIAQPHLSRATLPRASYRVGLDKSCRLAYRRKAHPAVHPLPKNDGQNLYLNEKGKNQIVCLAPLLATGAFLLPLAANYSLLFLQ